MVLATNLGFPRVGLKRELKAALEAYWAGKQTEEQLQATAKELRARHWKLQKDAGIDQIPSNDFTLYDHVLDTIMLTGAIPAAYGGKADLHTYFAMARGHQDSCCGHQHKSDNPKDVPALEMTKWFDTNYHYIVPAFESDQQFALSSTKPVDEFLEAKALGITTRPVLLGPVTFLSVGKCRDQSDPLALLPRLLPVYSQILEKLAAAGAEWVQIDEPVLALDKSPAVQKALSQAYATLTALQKRPKIVLATYFDTIEQNLETACGLKTEALHIDLVRAPGQLDAVLKALPAQTVLSVGVIDGRNIWRADLDGALKQVQKAVKALGADRVWVAPSCSLLHSPIDLSVETKLDDELKSWLAFATQKLDEIATLAKAASGADAKAEQAIAASREAIAARRSSARIHNPTVKQRVQAISSQQANRNSPYEKRRVAQAKRLDLPGLPTTTIGSFPQTKEIRAARADWRAGRKTQAEYDAFLEEQTRQTIKWQEEAGLDVLVHGEFERNDMVEYFGEQLQGFAFTGNGWVQSYGSRCVKPPIIFGDITRKGPMTVRWTKFAQSLTAQPVKGMLTGPVTILQWSFVRNDQPRSVTCRQIALAICDEVLDLEKAGIAAIQIDEPAIREGLPLQSAKRPEYIEWAVECFRLCGADVRDDTQIHTHMCYSEFNDIITAIAGMDADVISVETARSQMELLNAFVDFKYPNEIGPGVYDIHSPRVPSVDEMKDLIEKAAKLLPVERIWVNPDCGLKTRGWPETKAALANMVTAARVLREQFKLPKGKAKVNADKAA
ncbi:MAG: 5-methyltetrahydropteroyltriglutamate--homocysteine S-methyltransferase [Alphaproteobacteria bacterium]|nr:5-methyltetrahydropteroyltriglutamate--homocysteine S-methyltransferase [Alphaproteobacteria bacterium]